MFPGPLGASLAGKALAAGIWSLEALDIRDHATDKHRTVDDTPAGGGPGMVMKADVLATRARRGAARHAAPPADEPARSATDPAPGVGTRPRQRRGHPLRPLRGGRRAADRGAAAWRRSRSAISCCPAAKSRRWRCSMPACGCCRASWARRPRRSRKASPTGCWNIRNTPGPPVFEGEPIPEVLTSGDHAKVAAWRRAEAERLTRERAGPTSGRPTWPENGPKPGPSGSVMRGVTSRRIWSRSPADPFRI